MNFIERVVDLAIKIQQIPAPTFQENQRGQFIHQVFKSEGLADVEIDSAGNVYGRLAATFSRKSAKPIVISAHLDTIFPIDRELHIIRQGERLAGPGIGDNSIGLAGLVGLTWMLYERNVSLNRDIWLVANTGEEGLGNLVGMKAVCDRFKDQVKAYIILEGIGLGEIFHRALAVSRFRVTITTPGGHSWTDYGSPSAIHEIARLITSLDRLDLPANPRTTLNAGVISGGTSINTIAANASFELDIRSEQSDCLQDVVAQLNELIMGANRDKVRAYAELIGQRPSGAIPAGHWLVQLASRCLLDQGIMPNTHIGSTDANIPLSRGFPAICIGLTTGGRAHTMDEFIHITPLARGIESLFQIIYEAS